MLPVQVVIQMLLRLLFKRLKASVKCQNIWLARWSFGLEIAKERANANKPMGRFLNNMSVANIKFSLGGILGGAKNNAIPIECRATVLIEASSLEKVNLIIVL